MFSREACLQRVQAIELSTCAPGHRRFALGWLQELSVDSALSATDTWGETAKVIAGGEVAHSYCPGCGVQLSQGANFCANCGNIVPPASAPDEASAAIARAPSPRTAPRFRLDTIVAVAGILAVLFASIAKTHFATNLLGLAGWLSYTLGVLQQSAIELYGPAGAAERGIINPTLGWLASILAYLLFLIPVIASWQLWREWSGVDVRRWRLRTAGLFALIPVIAMAPWYLIVIRIPREVREYASASRNLSGSGSATGGGWDEAVLITSFVLGVGALLVAAWLASRNALEATPIPSEQSASGADAEEPVESVGAKSTHPGVGNSSNAKWLAIGGTAAVLLLSLFVLPSKQPSRPLTAAERAANDAATAAAIRNGEPVATPQMVAPPPSAGSDPPVPAPDAAGSTSSFSAICPVPSNNPVCVSVRYVDPYPGYQGDISSCQGTCASGVRDRLASQGLAATEGDIGGGAPGPSACVGFRPDLGGTAEGAQRLAQFLGPPYRVGPCSGDGFPYIVYTN